MAPAQETTIDVTELSVLTVKCAECGRGVVFEVSNRSVLPKQCPFCRSDFSKVGQLMGDYQKFYESVVDLPHSFEFRVKAVQV